MTVFLVGAGPGDPGLLTVRGAEVLARADVVVYDRLSVTSLLDLAPAGAERISVGKTPRGPSTPQEEINALLVERGAAGLEVVRLKGGDPFVFARGGEEAAALAAAGIAYEVVPGITAAVACASYAGIPLTHREHAQSLQLVTAHCGDALDTIDWGELARGRQTLAFYMGAGRLATIEAQLTAHGRDAGTPIAIVERGSHVDQRVTTGTLGQLADIAAHGGIASPALLFVGDVARFAAELNWFGAAPRAWRGTHTGSVRAKLEQAA